MRDPIQQFCSAGRAACRSASRRLAVLGAGMLALAAPGAAQVLAVRGGTVVHPTGERQEGVTVLLRDGRIQALGTDVELPFEADVIDATGKVVFPGMVLAHTSAGLDRENESLAVTPFVNVYDALDPNSVDFEEALRAGVTTLHVIPGNDCVMGGMSRIVRPLGAMVEDMTVRPEGGIKISMTPKRGYNRMTQMAELRKTFDDLHRHVEEVAERRYEEEQEKKGEKVLVPPEEAIEAGRPLVRLEDLEAKWQTLYLLERGQVRVFLNCDAASDVARGIDFAKERGILDQCTLLLGPETYKVVDAVKALGKPVILSGELVYTETDPLTGEEHETFAPKVFADAGVPFALLPGDAVSGVMGEGFLWYQAARLVREGVPRDVALKSITVWPAKILGMDQEVGDLQPGKLGNLLVLSGDPLAHDTVVEKVVVEGEVVYDRAEDRRLRELMTGKEEPVPEPEGGE